MDNNLQALLMPIGVLGTLATGFILGIQAFTDYFLRKKMIENGLIGDDASKILKKQESSRLASLKWGLIILFGGIGLILLDIIPYSTNSALPYGIVATSLSMGFLLYFIIVQRFSKDS